MNLLSSAYESESEEEEEEYVCSGCSLGVSSPHTLQPPQGLPPPQTLPSPQGLLPPALPSPQGLLPPALPSPQGLLPPARTRLIPPQNFLGRPKKDDNVPSFKLSQAVGYISKRKREMQDADPNMESAAPVHNVLSRYLTSVSSSCGSAAKQAKYGTRIIPKHCARSLSKPVLSLEWHPSDHRLLLSASLDGKLKLWDVKNQRNGCIASYEFHGAAAVRDVEWINDEMAMTAGYDNSAVYMDVGCGKEVTRLKHEGYITVVKPHPSDKNTILTGDFSGKLQFWDLRSGRATKQFKGAGGKVLDAVFLAREDYLVASSDIVRKNAFSQAMNVWDLMSTVTLTHQLYFEPFTCPCLRVHPSKDEFLAQSNGNYAVLFSAKKPFKLNKHRRFQGHSVSGFDVGFDISSDGSILCSASSEGKVHFYDYTSTRMIRTMSLTDSVCLAVAWNRNATCRVAVSDWKGGVYILE